MLIRAQKRGKTSMSNMQAGQDESGSAYRWVILLVTWAAFLLSFIDRLAWGNVAVSVGASLGMSIAALGVFVTAFYVGYVTPNAIGGVFPPLLWGRPMPMGGLVGPRAVSRFFSFFPNPPSRVWFFGVL